MPPAITPVVKNRIQSSMTDGMQELPTDEWMPQTLSEAITFLVKTGSKKG